MNGDPPPTGVDVLGPPVTFPFTGVPFGAVEPLRMSIGCFRFRGGEGFRWETGAL